MPPEHVTSSTIAESNSQSFEISLLVAGIALIVYALMNLGR
jgi:hypothetical protein